MRLWRLWHATHRLAPVFLPDQVIGLDAVDRIPELVNFAAVDLSQAVKWLKATG